MSSPLFTCLPEKIIAMKEISVSKKPRRVCRPQAAKKSDHFPPGRVPGGKYLTGCKCASCPPKADKECARQTAILLSKKAVGLF